MKDPAEPCRTAVVVAAGMGSRLGDQTRNTPKPLVEVGGRPLLWYVLRGLGLAGIRRCVVVVGYLRHLIESRLPGLVPAGMEVTTVVNPAWERPNGLSVLRARAELSDVPRFVVHMADHLIEPQALECLLGSTRVPGLLVDPNPSATCDLEDATRVWVEDASVCRIGKLLEPFNGVDTGAFILDHSVFGALEESADGGDESLTGGMRRLARRGSLAAVALPAGAEWLDIDTARDLALAARLLAAGWGHEWMSLKD